MEGSSTWSQPTWSKQSSGDLVRTRPSATAFQANVDGAKAGSATGPRAPRRGPRRRASPSRRRPTQRRDHLEPPGRPAPATCRPGSGGERPRRATASADASWRPGTGRAEWPGGEPPAFDHVRLRRGDSGRARPEPAVHRARLRRRREPGGFRLRHSRVADAGSPDACALLGDRGALLAQARRTHLPCTSR